MPDLWIRNVPAEDLALLDQHAARLGLSRTEFLRRQLRQVARRDATTVTTADLKRLGAAAADLGNPAVLSDAWS